MQLRVAKHRVQKTFSKSFASRLLLAQKKLIKNLPLSAPLSSTRGQAQVYVYRKPPHTYI